MAFPNTFKEENISNSFLNMVFFLTLEFLKLCLFLIASCKEYKYREVTERVILCSYADFPYLRFDKVVFSSG